MGRIGAIRGVGGLLAVLVAVAATATAWIGHGREERSTGDVERTDSIHLRILAHSDSEEDQLLKARVGAEVGRALREWLGGRRPADAEDVRAALLPRLDELSRRVDGVLKHFGAPYSAEVEWGVFPMPEKWDGSAHYPAGRYEMLRIVLGAGQGHNFWCVLFPSLCFQESENCSEARSEDKNAKKPKVSWWVVERVKKAFRGAEDGRDARGRSSEKLSSAWFESVAKAARFFRSEYNGIGK